MATQTERTRTTKAAIVSAATASFVEAGSIDVSLESIADRAGVAKSTALYHFDSRTGILQAVAINLFRDLVQRVEDSADQDLVTWATHILGEQTDPSAVVLHRIGDELLQHGELGETDPIVPLADRLRAGGMGDSAGLLATAMFQYAREIAYGHRNPADIGNLLNQLR